MNEESYGSGGGWYAGQGISIEHSEVCRMHVAFVPLSGALFLIPAFAQACSTICSRTDVPLFASVEALELQPALSSEDLTRTSRRSVGNDVSFPLKKWIARVIVSGDC